MLARRRLTSLGSLVVPEYRQRLWWYHRAIAGALEGLLTYVRYKGKRGGYSRVSISMPPQHGKSLHGTQLFPAFALGQCPDLKFIVASNTAGIAKKDIGALKQWMTHEEYQRSFSTRIGKVDTIDADGKPVKLETDSAAQFLRTLRPEEPGSKRYVESQGYYLAQGVGGSIVGWGYDIGIMDDLIKNAEQAQSPAYLSKLWDFYTSTFDTRARSQYAGLLYVSTRWTTPDFADELVSYWESEAAAQKNPGKIKVLKFPALAEEPLQDGDERQPGEGLDKHTIRNTDYYIGKRDALMQQGRSWVWFGTWQQQPKMAGAKFFQPSDWVTYGETFKLRNLNFVDFSIDANLSATGASYAVILVTGVLQVGTDMPNEEGEHYFLLDEARGHFDYEELEAEFLRLRRKWEIALPRQTNLGAVWVENKALGPTLISKYGGRYPLVAVPKAKSKTYCYRVASPVTAQHRVRIPTGTWGEDPTDPSQPLITDEWIGTIRERGSWVHEMASHPSRPDDRRDALAQQIICRTSWLGMHLLGAS